MSYYIIGLEVVDGVPNQYIAPWSGDPGRTCVEESARKYKSAMAATMGLANARRYREYLNAVLIKKEPTNETR